MEAAGLTWRDFNLLVPDGASNCEATLDLLHEEVDSEVCYCHAVARAVLTSIGMGAAAPAEYKDELAQVESALKKMRALAFKCHRSGKLNAALHASQAAAGVERELETIKAAITRWNGVYMGTIRNLQLFQHVTHALRTTATFEVYTENEDGEEEVVETSSRAITPTDEEWTIAAEVAAVLKLPFVLTQKLQGLQTPP